MTWWASATPVRIVFEKAIGQRTKAKSATPIIDSFLELPEGWHYGEGRGTTEAAAKAARKVDALFLGTNARVIEVFPDLDGGIVVCGRHENEDVEVICQPDGRLMSMCHEINDEPVYEKDNITLEDITDYVERLPWELRSFDCSTLNTIVETRTVLKVKHFRIPETAAERLFFVPNVPGRKTILNAGMCMLVTIPKYQAIPQFYGGLTPMNYLMGASPNAPRPTMTPVI